MKYVWAVLAVLAELFGYIMLIGLMQWRLGGGAIMFLLFIAAAVGTWIAITNKGKTA